MKKIISVFLALALVFSICTIAVFAEEPVTDPTTTAAQEETDPVTPEATTAIDLISTTVKEERTTRNIQNDDGLVVPLNTNQLKFSVIFKIFEKIFKFILSLFGVKGPDVDNDLSSAVEEIGTGVDERLTDLLA